MIDTTTLTAHVKAPQRQYSNYMSYNDKPSIKRPMEVKQRPVDNNRQNKEKSNNTPDRSNKHFNQLQAQHKTSPKSISNNKGSKQTNQKLLLEGTTKSRRIDRQSNSDEVITSLQVEPLATGKDYLFHNAAHKLVAKKDDVKRQSLDNSQPDSQPFYFREELLKARARRNNSIKSTTVNPTQDVISKPDLTTELNVDPLRTLESRSTGSDLKCGGVR